MVQQKKRPEMNLLLLQRQTILDQLHIEEALLRADERNWCIIHQNPLDAIVMGISAKPDQVLDFSKLQQQSVPVIRRFSGGGTVYIDENCLMTSFICNELDMDVPCFPQPVFHWSETFYQPVFENLEFKLRENDYVLGHKKFGGNAQYMTKKRWLHHTSFLWDYQEEKMGYLKMPTKTPQYRQQRSHTEFLDKLKNHFTHMPEIVDRVKSRLNDQFHVRNVTIADVQEVIKLPHRRVSSILNEVY